ncbi:membrane protein insertase YidC [Alkalicaulis satelles]|uniref:membrane protein insertase YidC n=1 Tax=Alkalicaulis satelles TaxID=2609175 RepID=UPI001E613789|nr:membrane protein insertase YidC [Alkalicaulis satelles]
MGDPNNTRNLILFVVLVVAVMVIYDLFVLQPGSRERAAREAAQVSEQQTPAPSDDAPQAPDGDFATERAPSGPAVDLTRESALARSERINIRTPALSGTMALTGARLDDLQLLRYDTEVNSGVPVTLLNPEGSPNGHFMFTGWIGGSDAPSGLPALNTRWRLVEGNELTPDSPVVLEYQTGDLVFRRTVSVDENYLFSFTDTVTNTGAGTVSLRRFGVVRQENIPPGLLNFFILHEGAVGVVGDRLVDRKFNNLQNDRMIERTGQGGWMGFTSKYWLAATAPEGLPDIRGQFRVLDRPGPPVFEANYLGEPVALAPGQTLTDTSMMFAGAKSSSLLSRYEREAGIPRLSQAIDWGMFWFLTRPFFAVIHYFYGLIGNYGLALMLFVLLIKIPLFPLNNRAFASMAKMRAVAPRMTEIRERHKDNPQAQQQAMLELYKREKINPLAGCLPILPQIPIFFAVYKTVFISLDARHAPFFGWIQDMSAPDPTTIWNLFGLLPYDPSGVPIISNPYLAIGVWPIIMGVTMWAQMSLNPPPPDKIQRQIFAFLPVVFTFVLAPFAAALVIYWAWNNTLTIAQQYIIMRRQGVQTELDKAIARLRARMKGEPEPDFSDTAKDAKPGATLEEKAAAATSATLKAARPAETQAPDEDDAGEDAKPAPAKPAGTRTRSNPAAKKKRSGAARRKPGGKR